MAWECATPAKALNHSRGNQGNAVHPPPALTTMANSRLPPFSSWPQPKTDHTQSSTEERMTRSCSCPFSKSWPCHSVCEMLQQGLRTHRWTGKNCTNWFGCSGIQCELPVLWGTCTTNSAIGSVIGARGDRGAAIQYLGFMEVNLQILGIANYYEDILLLVIPTTTYSETVPAVVGSKIIDKALSLMAKGELAKVTMTWRQSHFGAFMSGSGSLQLSHTSSNKIEVGEEVSHSSQSSDPVEVRKFLILEAQSTPCKQSPDLHLAQ